MWGHFLIVLNLRKPNPPSIWLCWLTSIQIEQLWPEQWRKLQSGPACQSQVRLRPAGRRQSGEDGTQLDQGPGQSMCETRIEAEPRQIPAAVGSSLSVSLITDGCENSASGVRYLEHLQARISLKYQPRGDLRISLKSPRGTTSHLLLPRPKDRVGSTFDNWPFLSVHYWGEDPTGEWKLGKYSWEIVNPSSEIAWVMMYAGIVRENLKVYGELRDRIFMSTNILNAFTHFRHNQIT